MFLPLFWSYCLHCLQKVRSHTKAKGSNFHIINIWLLISIYKIVTVTPVYNLLIMGIYLILAIAYSNVTVLMIFFIDRNKQTKSKTCDCFATNLFAMLSNIK